MTGAPVATYNGDSDVALTVAWSPDGKYIASGSQSGIVKVWDIAKGINVCIFGSHADIMRAIAWSPDGTSIASAGYGVRIWLVALG